MQHCIMTSEIEPCTESVHICCDSEHKSFWSIDLNKKHDGYVIAQVEDPLLERQEQWDKKTGAEKRRKREWATNLEAPTD